MNGVTLGVFKKYPYKVNSIPYETLKEFLNTKMQINVIQADDENNILAYSIQVLTVENDTPKYAGLTQEFLDDCPLIEVTNGKMMIGYIECEVIGYVPLPHCIYLLKILE